MINIAEAEGLIRCLADRQLIKFLNTWKQTNFIFRRWFWLPWFLKRIDFQILNNIQKKKYYFNR